MAPKTDKRKYLQPETVAMLNSMALRARLVVEGYIIGQHRSPYHGFSVELQNIVPTVLAMKFVISIGSSLEKQTGFM